MADSSLASLGPPLPASYSGRVTDVAWSQNGGLLTAVGLDSTIRLWDFPETGTEPVARPMAVAHEAGVTAVAASPDGSMLATASYDKTAKLWAIAPATSPKLLATIESDSPLLGVAFSADRNIIAIANEDNIITLWDIRTRTDPPSPTDPAEFNCGTRQTPFTFARHS